MRASAVSEFDFIQRLGRTRGYPRKQLLCQGTLSGWTATLRGLVRSCRLELPKIWAAVQNSGTTHDTLGRGFDPRLTCM